MSSCLHTLRTQQNGTYDDEQWHGRINLADETRPLSILIHGQYERLSRLDEFRQNIEKMQEGRLPTSLASDSKLTAEREEPSKREDLFFGRSFAIAQKVRACLRVIFIDICILFSRKHFFLFYRHNIIYIHMTHGQMFSTWDQIWCIAAEYVHFSLFLSLSRSFVRCFVCACCFVWSIRSIVFLF